MMSGRVSPSESEDEEDIYSDCLVSLSSDGGSRGITILPGGLKLPRLRRRPSGKRQAPQPPRRPAPTSTPAPQSPPDTTTPAPSSPPDTTTPAPSSPPDTTTLAPQSPPDTTTPAPSSPPDTTIPAPLPVTTSLTPPSSSELLATVTLEDNTTATPDITPTPSLSTTPIPSLSTTPTPSLSTTPIPSLSTTPTPSLSTTPTPSLSTTPTPSPVPTPTPSPTPPITTVQMVLKPDSSPVSDMAPISTTSPSISTTSSTIPQSVEAPPPPPRSASVGATRNMMIRLIDDDSDSESVMSDYFEDHIVFPPRPSPLPYSPPVVVTQTPLTSPTYLPRPPMSPPIVPPGGVVSGGVVTRGRARRLMHSNSDPGLPRAPRPLYSQEQYPRLPQYSQEQYPRLPQSHYPQLPRPQFPPPPLELVSEEEGEDDGSVPHRGTGLRRTSSTMTVGSLREELLVTPGILKLRLTLTNITVMTLVAAFALPHASILLYTGFRLVFGTLFPAYYSYKAVKTKNVKEYVKWMMYWIVFAFFTCFETLTDLFISFWFPFYYELKILVVLWLLSPATRGSSILYRKFVHPWLARREEDIDQCIAQARQQGYSTVVQLGTKGVNYATTVLMQTAIKASRGGGGLMNQLRRSYSQSELVGSDDADMNRNVKALPPHLHGDPHYADYALDHHTLPQGSTSQGVVALSSSQPLSTSQGVLAIPSQSLATSHGVVALPSQSLATSQGVIQVPSHTQPLIQHALASQQFGTSQPHSPETLQFIQQHMTTPVDPRSTLQHHTLTPEALLSLQQHMATPIVSGQSEDPYSSVCYTSEDPYSPVRYTLSLGTPQGQIITPAVLKDTVDASYSPPLTRHRAKIQQTASEQSS